MTKKEYLSRAFILNKKIRRKEVRIDNLRASIGVVSVKPDEAHVKSVPHSPFESDLVFVIDLEKDVEKMKKELEAIKKEIWRSIHTIGDDKLESVLELRYIAFKEWNEIADEMWYSVDYIFRLHREAVDVMRML